MLRHVGGTRFRGVSQTLYPSGCGHSALSKVGTSYIGRAHAVRQAANEFCMVLKLVHCDWLLFCTLEILLLT